MPYLTWEETVPWLRDAKLKISPCLLISEIQMRWKNASFGNLQIIPLKEDTHSIIEGYDIIHKTPYSRLLVAFKKYDKMDESLLFEGICPGPALSSILSFILRSLVVSCNEFHRPLHVEKDRIRLSLPGQLWAEGWNSCFMHQKGLREYLSSYVPTLQEEEALVKSMERVYAVLMKIDEDTYNAIMGALRLYQLALFVARVDYSLAYSLLVAAVDAVSSRLKVKLELKDIDPEGKLEKSMKELQLDEGLQNAINNIVLHHETLTKRFSDFIRDNLPDTFWKGDYSLVKELNLISEHYWSGQFYRDLSECVPEPTKTKLLKMGEQEEKAYEEFKKQRRSRQQGWIFNNERRKWMMIYLRVCLDRVLANTFAGRSELLHFGRGFPKFALKEEFTDWIPDVFEEDLREFIWGHFEHKWNYLPPNEKGKIFRICSCGEKKEVKVMFGIRVFEKIVHDSILNYILKLGQ